MQTPPLHSRPGFLRDDRGTAAIEFAAVAMLLVVILGNAVDFGVYQYRSMQVQEAAQSAPRPLGACATVLRCFRRPRTVPV